MSPQIQELTRVQVLKQFFQLKGQTIVQFAQELKALSEEEKAELSEMAAKEMGVTIKA